MMRNVKILFQGDSITDAGRDYADNHDLGIGYPKYAAEKIRADFPETEFEFVNLGISGHQTKDLVTRLESDFIAIDPDIVSILIGINDVWHHASERDWILDEVFEERYRTILETIRTKTHAKIMILEPFLLPAVDKQFFREDLSPKIEIIRKLAREYADVYLPTDGLLQSAIIGQDFTEFSSDGVHPAPRGCAYIGKLYADYVSALIKQLM